MQELYLERYYNKLVQPIERRISLDSEEKAICVRSLDYASYCLNNTLLAQGDICRYESYVCEGFLRSFYMGKNGTEQTLHFALEDWWISDLHSF